MIDPLALAGDLIRIPSRSGDTEGMRAVQRHVVEAIRAEIPEVQVADGGADRPWTLISLGPKAPAPLLACHTDTVPVGDTGQWTHDPLSGAVEGPHLHGRGSVDMKGGLAAAAAAVVSAARRGAPSHLLLTADEEIGSLGAQLTREAIADLDLTGIIIPEATQLGVHCCHRGACWLRLISHGRSAHGSAPERGINAVTRLASAIGPALQDAPLRRDDVLGTETASVGTFSGGEATNIVPARATATVDHRTIADSAPLREHWSRIDGIDEVETILDLSALRTDESADFVRTLPADVVPAPVTYFTDGSVLQDFRPDVPVVIWGPGDPTQMHSADEHLEISQLTTAARLYEEALVSGAVGPR